MRFAKCELRSERPEVSAICQLIEFYASIRRRPFNMNGDLYYGKFDIQSELTFADFAVFPLRALRFQKKVINVLLIFRVLQNAN